MVPLLYLLVSMLLLLRGQYLLNFIHLFLSLIVINDILMLLHHIRSIARHLVHLSTTAIVSKPAVCFDRFNILCLWLFRLFLHFIVLLIK